MAAAEFKRWTLPQTEIRIARVDTGARAGEYLFSAETVERIPDFYDKIEDLPYGPGSSEGIFGFAVYSPAGLALALRRVVPPRWLLDLPPWALTGSPSCSAQPS
jgi:MscS family membrane protein